MILLDPDLDPDPDARPQAFASKRASPIRPIPIDRDARVPSARALSRFLREAQGAVRLRGQVSVLLTTNKNIRRLNRQFRGKDKATDVLSFPAAKEIAAEAAGDLAVSVPTAMRQAREQGHALAVELKVLILHGLLHLAGFDHERDGGEMARRERRLRARLRLPQGLIERNSGDSGTGRRQGSPTLLTEKSRKDGARKKLVRGRTARNADPSTARLTGVSRSAQDDKQLSDDRHLSARRGRRA